MFISLSRYSYDEIDEAIRLQIAKHKLQIPVYRVLPGMLVRDVLSNQETMSPGNLT